MSRVSPKSFESAAQSSLRMANKIDATLQKSREEAAHTLQGTGGKWSKQATIRLAATQLTIENLSRTARETADAYASASTVLATRVQPSYREVFSRLGTAPQEEAITCETESHVPQHFESMMGAFDDFDRALSEVRCSLQGLDNSQAIASHLESICASQTMHAKKVRDVQGSYCSFASSFIDFEDQTYQLFTRVLHPNTSEGTKSRSQTRVQTSGNSTSTTRSKPTDGSFLPYLATNIPSGGSTSGRGRNGYQDVALANGQRPYDPDKIDVDDYQRQYDEALGGEGSVLHTAADVAEDNVPLPGGATVGDIKDVCEAGNNLMSDDPEKQRKGADEIMMFASEKYVETTVATSCPEIGIAMFAYDAVEDLEITEGVTVGDCMDKGVLDPYGMNDKDLNKQYGHTTVPSANPTAGGNAKNADKVNKYVNETSKELEDRKELKEKRQEECVDDLRKAFSSDNTQAENPTAGGTGTVNVEQDTQ